MIDNVWQVIPGSVEWHRCHDGILSLYVGPRGKANQLCAQFPEHFVHRWTIWFFGTLLGEGACETPQAAMGKAEQEGDRVLQRIRDHVRTIDIRNNRPAAEIIAAATSKGTL